MYQRTDAFQEIGEILSNTLTLDEEEAVQAELLQLQEETVHTSISKGNLSLTCLQGLLSAPSKTNISLPDAPKTEPLEEDAHGQLLHCPVIRLNNKS